MIQAKLCFLSYVYKNICCCIGTGMPCSREEDLMTALKLLLDRLNAGQIPINDTVLQQLKRSNTSGGGMGMMTETNETNITGFQVSLGIYLEKTQEAKCYGIPGQKRNVNKRYRISGRFKYYW